MRASIFILFWMGMVLSPMAFAEEPIARISDPANDQVNAEARKAGTKRLGTDEDVGIIKELLKAAYPKMELQSIRWASDWKAFARAQKGNVIYLCLFQKNTQGWQLKRVQQTDIWD